MIVDFPIPHVESTSVPRIAASTLLAGTLPEVSHRGGAPTIVLVEDEAFVRRVTAEALASAGYALVSAAGAVEALAACSGFAQPIDLLLADIILPGMSGRELAAQFERRFPSARVLLMSGYPEQLARHDTCAATRQYLAKPFSLGALLQRVRDILDSKLAVRP